MKGSVEALPIGLELRGPVLTSLSQVVREQVPGPMEQRLAEIRDFLEGDLDSVNQDLDALEMAQTPLHDSARHLIGLGGKRIRPMCVALAARIGTGFGPGARDLAVAAELVHSATLLHDDVVDSGDKRRGAPTARVLYGNAASIFAGDWLLVEALMRVRRTRLPDVLDKALGVLAEMLEAEALQLARRGRADVSMSDYMRVVNGKTASLFRWALFAGGRAGGLDDDACKTLERFGEAMGVAFQVVDDVLDVDGDPETVGKELFADLKDGKVTYPLMVALEHDRDLQRALKERLAGGTNTLDGDLAARAHRAIKASGGVAKARALAEDLIGNALRDLSALPDKPATRALVSVAHAIANRRK